MTRHGRCQCGMILVFQQGPQGYKTRCPGCGAVVRLRVDDEPTRARAPNEPVVPPVSDPGAPQEHSAWPPLGDELPGARAFRRRSSFELEVRAPRIAQKSVVKRRGRRLWWAAGLALLTAGLLVLVWWFTHQATGVS